jgi:hypothetical protein
MGFISAFSARRLARSSVGTIRWTINRLFFFSSSYQPVDQHLIIFFVDGLTTILLLL